MQSGHPIAATIVREAATSWSPALSATEAHAVPGRGVTAMVDGALVLVGTPDLLSQHGITLPREVQAELDRLNRSWNDASGSTGKPRSGSDSGRGLDPSEAAEAVADLRRLGPVPTILTGDTGGAARRIAALVGVEDVRASLLPEDKMAAVREMAAKGERPCLSAMVSMTLRACRSVRRESQWEQAERRRLSRRRISR
jgi:cation transport ATPase